MHRITLILLLSLLLPDLYIYLVYIVRQTKNFAWRAAYWLPSAVLVVLYMYLIYLTGDNAMAHHPQAIGHLAVRCSASCAVGWAAACRPSCCTPPSANPRRRSPSAVRRSPFWDWCWAW